MNVHEFTVKSIKSYANIRAHSGPYTSSITSRTALGEHEGCRKNCRVVASLHKVTTMLQILTSCKNRKVKYQGDPSCYRILSAEHQVTDGSLKAWLTPSSMF